jgi:TRAP transporter TAXI family solute receptor
MKKTVVMLIITLAAILTAPMILIPSASAAEEDQAPVTIEIYTTPNGTSTFIVGVALADMINADSKWLKATALESPGGTETTMMFIQDPAVRDHAIGYSIVQDALIGNPPFNGPYDDMRGLFSFGMSWNVMMTNDDSIKTMQDLNGKPVAVGLPPNMVRYDIPVKTFELMGIKPSRIEKLGFTQSVDALVDKKVAAIFAGGFAVKPDGSQWSSNPALAELLARSDVRYLSWDPEKLLQAKKELKHELMPGIRIMPPNASDNKFQTEKVYLMSDFMGFTAHKDLPDRIIKEILRIVLANVDKFVNYLPTGAYMTKETLAMMDTPEYIHPTAKAFYESVGIKVPTREELMIYEK